MRCRQSRSPWANLHCRWEPAERLVSARPQRRILFLQMRILFLQMRILFLQMRILFLQRQLAGECLEASTSCYRHARAKYTRQMALALCSLPLSSFTRCHVTQRSGHIRATVDHLGNGDECTRRAKATGDSWMVLIGSRRRMYTLSSLSLSSCLVQL